MASIHNTVTGEVVGLLTRHVIGRHPTSANTLLDNPKISRLHAPLSWNNDGWSIQDTSTNGTYINGIRLLPHIFKSINCGDVISFIGPDIYCWVVDDVSPPQNMLVPETLGTPLIALDKLVVLPRDTSPQVTLYQSQEGDWLCESEMGTSVLVNGSTVCVDNNRWRFVETCISTETLLMNIQQIIGLAEIEVDFAVSQNEEHVCVQLNVGQQQFSLGERNHHYLLLLLARQYMKDKALGLLDSELGWIDKDLLATMLQLSENHINMHIYRFRLQVTEALSQHFIPPQMVQRRRGEVRFVCDNVHIEGGTT